MRNSKLAITCVAAALAGTLAIKVSSAVNDRPGANDAARNAHLHAALEENGFGIGTYLEDRDPPLLRAHKADCSLQIARASPLGWHRDVLEKITGPEERLFFVFGGEVFDKQPVWRTTLSYHWRRVLTYAGMSGAQSMMLAIIATRNCDTGAIDWSQMAKTLHSRG